MTAVLVVQMLNSHMKAALERDLPAMAAKPRILICAPSNAAADELLQRVMDDRFADGDGRMYSPNVIRIGEVIGSRQDPCDVAHRVINVRYSTARAACIARRSFTSVTTEDMGRKGAAAARYGPLCSGSTAA